MKRPIKKFFNRSHPYQYHQRNFATIPEAKKAGAIDRIENGETKLKLLTLFQENMNYIKLTEIPQTYFLRFDRALEYTGKFMYRINDEMPNILTSYESENSKEIIVRLSEPYQIKKCDILPKIKTESYDSEMNEGKEVKYQAYQNREQSVETVGEWLNKQHTDEEEIDMQNYDKKKIEVKGAINLRVVFDEDDLNYISPLQRDVLEFLFKEF
ncbi:hypothetical protein RhiirA5_345519 [Rhizophagus irregularis]|uniref:Uncharacterized protein n=1 Tax=Rhizophagus irregularis TaxID=588596 RepID=A0A2I1DRB7_9GLOM|nr:hypothetical protein RhiirA5_345519 [Rhizophagus irregularis]PKY12418.1 hypothetical protein RhiirB3_133060 [Rhizophagus irregularis]CAB5091748.1 unnamed protein product [Rhizophagus irregularis]CAB5391997.1 unnamed protein product [Rhizophagus irregularis]